MTHYLARQIIQCPVGCAFLYTIERDSIPIEKATQPKESFARLARAHADLSPWGAEFRRLSTELLSLGPRWVDLACRLLDHPGSDWWTEQLDPDRQILISAPPYQPLEKVNRQWESYAQRPTGWRATSTERSGITSLYSSIWYGTGDWPMPSSIERHKALISRSARVLEIAGPQDWHSFCTTYPFRITRRIGLEQDYSLSPDWQEVQNDLDGIHISFMAQLTAPFVKKETEHGTSALRAWQSEATVWVPGKAMLVGAELEHEEQVREVRHIALPK